MTELGFVIVRYVNSAETNEYWKTCYLQIRKHYPDSKILIVDDASNEQYLSETGFEMTLCTVIKAEYPRRGELLGYYYFHKLKPFDKAVVIHDNVFINRRLNFNSVASIQYLWSFDHTYDDLEHEEELLRPFDESINALHKDRAKWLGCYGVMSVVSWTFLNDIDARFNLFANLLPLVTARVYRMALERIFACVCTVAEPSLSRRPHFIGDIHCYRWGRNITFNQYREGGVISTMPLIKILSGR